MKQIVRRDFTPQPVTPEDRDRYIDTRVNSTLHRSFEGGPEFAARLRKNLEAAQWPETRPAYRQMVVDAAGNVWIEHYRDYYLEEERYAAGKWSIFSRDGDWLGDVAVPARFRPDRIYEDALIGRWTDEDEAMRVRMYRLRKFANN